MSVNGSGIRDTARVLKISPTTVINTLKKRACAHLAELTTPQHVAS
jgi:transposase-like protein